MNSNPLSGLILILLGTLSTASFYVPFNKVRNMAWEVYWLIAGLFSWIVVPVIIALITVPFLFKLYGTMSFIDLFYPFIFGLLYGFGGLTFGLSMRLPGSFFSYALTLGIIAALGTLIPTLVNGIIVEMVKSIGGIITLGGIRITVLGILITGWAGIMKFKFLSEEKKKETIGEFNLRKGALVVLFAGYYIPPLPSLSPPDQETVYKKKKVIYKIIEKGYRNKPLTKEQIANNKEKS